MKLPPIHAARRIEDPISALSSRDESPACLFERHPRLADATAVILESAG
jgi:hypothetical protein